MIGRLQFPVAFQDGSEIGQVLAVIGFQKSGHLLGHGSKLRQVLGKTPEAFGKIAMDQLHKGGTVAPAQAADDGDIMYLFLG